MKGGAAIGNPMPERWVHHLVCPAFEHREEEEEDNIPKNMSCSFQTDLNGYFIS